MIWSEYPSVNLKTRLAPQGRLYNSPPRIGGRARQLSCAPLERQSPSIPSPRVALRATRGWAPAAFQAARDHPGRQGFPTRPNLHLLDKRRAELDGLEFGRALQLADEIAGDGFSPRHSETRLAANGKASIIKSMATTTMSGLLRLPRRKRLEIAERLWYSVAREADPPIPAEHKRFLDQRMADYKSGKSKPISHAELMRRVRAS